MMDKNFQIILTLISLGLIYCEEECLLQRSHRFEVEADVKLSFSTKINDNLGLVIDIDYENRRNDRIKLSPLESLMFMHNGRKYIKTMLNNTVIEKGWQDINIFVGKDTLYINSTSSKMSPLATSIHTGKKWIRVSSDSIKICDESCNIKTSIEKVINNEEVFKITAFTTSNYPITYKIEKSVEEGSLSHILKEPVISPGWNTFTIFVNRTSLVINGFILPIYFSFKTLTISGEYLVNCTRGTPSWKISKDKEIAIPIPSSLEYVFILSSNSSFSPIINLNEHKYILNWDKGLTFNHNGSPLEPNTYNITFETRSDMLTLFNEAKTSVLLKIKIAKRPQFIRVSSNKGEYLLALSVQESIHQPIKPSSTGIPMEQTTKEPSTFVNLILIIVVIVIIIAALTLIIATMRLKIATNPKGEEVENLISANPGATTIIEMEDKGVTKNVHGACEEEVKKLVSTKNLEALNISIEDYEKTNSVKLKKEVMKTEEDSPKRLISKKKWIKTVNADQTNLDSKLKDFGKSKPVIQVMEELQNAIDSVFKAITNKQLYGPNSADSLLKSHGLPGTIRDSQGNSLLHCVILSMQQDEQNPDVNDEDLKKFIIKNKLFVNAANYKGQTPLHILVKQASKSYSTKEWGNMAQILLDIGCDPRFHDHNGQLPEDIALFRGCLYLQNLLKKKRMEKGEMKSQKHHWPYLLNKTKENQTESVRNILLKNVPILPLSSTSDPLREAIQRGYIELTMLLLSAGAPLCGRSFTGLNSLEVSHSSPRLPRFLTALIRREFYNCLRSESEMFNCENDDLVQLKQAVIHLSEAIKKDGYKNASWNFNSKSLDVSERSKEARKMLRLAASKGMGLTCQMLGLENVFLHSLPLEISADRDAKPNTLVVLCRDLDLSLSLKESNIPSQLKEEYEEYNFKTLRAYCQKNRIQINCLYDKQSTVNIKVLKYIAEQGLDFTYKIIYRSRNKEIVDLIVDPVTGFTMLHSAAYSGRMSMVEYLLLNNADERIKTREGFTAAHIAAMRGHKECMEYILEFSKLRNPLGLTNNETNSGLTAHQIADGYSLEINNLSTFLLPVDVGHSILSEPDIEIRTKIILEEKKSVIQECLSSVSLDHIIPQSYINEHETIWQQLMEESESFIQRLIDADSRFKGKIINSYRQETALELLLMDSYQVCLEIDNYDLWHKENLHGEFLQSCSKAFQHYTVKSNNLCIVPEVFKPTVLGASFVLAYCSKQIITHVIIHVIPVLNEKLPLNTEGLHLSQLLIDTISQVSVVHIANTSSEKWNYITDDIEVRLFSKVDHNKLVVYQICRLIKKLFNPHWWFPGLESRQHGRQYCHHSPGEKQKQSVPEKQLRSCFLWEVFNVPKENWGNSNVLERVIDVFQNMALENENEEAVVKCFLDPGRKERKAWKVSSEIQVIINFLQEL